MPSQAFLSQMTKRVLKNSLNVTGYICLSLFELGEIMAKSFLNPYECLGYSRKKSYNIPDFLTKNNINSGIRRLIDQGMVEKKGNATGLTKTGKKVIERILGKKKILEKKWDGKYRLVIFDIPENKKKIRNWLRGELYLLNYIQLQKSVFIGKYPLTPDTVSDIRKHRIHEHVNYLLVDKIYDERKLKFGSRK
ncbi:MAG: hypothetical protein QMD77_02430 [Patescibacteria group bacterium]|nr:hypothetical protein [Patescibacteria group bacterium]